MNLPRYLALFTLLALTALQATSWYFGANVFRRSGSLPPFVRADSPLLLVFSPLVPVLVTLLVLPTGLYAIGSKKYQDSQKKWAYGAVGTILGYWLG